MDREPYPGQRLRPASHRWPILAVLGLASGRLPGVLQAPPCAITRQAETAAEGDADLRFAKTRRADGLIARSATARPGRATPRGARSAGSTIGACRPPC